MSKFRSRGEYVVLNCNNTEIARRGTLAEAKREAQDHCPASGRLKWKKYQAIGWPLYYYSDGDYSTRVDAGEAAAEADVAADLTRTTCQRCAGTGSSPSAFTFGRGMIDCGDCDGTGTIWINSAS